MANDYTGISFPFRIGVKGGVVTSTTNPLDVQHICESIEQITGTKPLERIMEYHIKSDISTYVFDPNDESTRALIAHECRKAIEECDERIEVVSVNPYTKDNIIYAEVHFKVKRYGNKPYSVTVKVGEMQ